MREAGEVGCVHVEFGRRGVWRQARVPIARRSLQGSRRGADRQGSATFGSRTELKLRRVGDHPENVFEPRATFGDRVVRLAERRGEEGTFGGGRGSRASAKEKSVEHAIRVGFGAEGGFQQGVRAGGKKIGERAAVGGFEGLEHRCVLNALGDDLLAGRPAEDGRQGVRFFVAQARTREPSSGTSNRFEGVGHLPVTHDKASRNCSLDIRRGSGPKSRGESAVGFVRGWVVSR